LTSEFFNNRAETGEKDFWKAVIKGFPLSNANFRRGRLLQSSDFGGESWVTVVWYMEGGGRNQTKPCHPTNSLNMAYNFRSRNGGKIRYSEAFFALL